MPINYIIYDLEAACWLGRPPKGINEIIEIGAVRINEYGEILSTFESFVKPTLSPKLSGFCKKLTSISQEQVNTAQHFPKVISDFKEWTGMYEDDFYLCSWGSNDKKLFFDECQIHKLDSDWTEKCENLKTQYDVFKDASIKGNLKKIVTQEGFDFTGIQHRAISDAENLAKVFLKYFDEWAFY